MTRLEKYLNEVEARCAAATKGPWSYEHNRVSKSVEINEIFFDHDLVNDSWIDSALDDAKFIAHARQDVEVLLKLVNELLRQNDDMYSLLIEQYNSHPILKELESLIPESEV